VGTVEVGIPMIRSLREAGMGLSMEILMMIFRISFWEITSLITTSDRRRKLIPRGFTKIQCGLPTFGV
jgi:hypothetical protein